MIVCKFQIDTIINFSFFPIISQAFSHPIPPVQMNIKEDPSTSELKIFNLQQGDSFMLQLKYLLAILLIFSISCEKAAEDSSETEESESAKVGTLEVGDDALQDLNVSSSLTADVPDSVSGSGDGVDAGTIAVTALTARTKSREACMIRQKIKEAKMNEEMMAMDLCFIESQKGMKLGGKYKLTFSGGPAGGPGGDDGPGGPGGDGGPGGPGGDGGPGEYDEMDGPGLNLSDDMTMAVYLDNTDPDKLTVFMCDGGKLTQKIVIDSASDKGSKGRYKSIFESDGFKIAMQGAFDSGVTEVGRHVSTSQMEFTFSMGTETMTARSNMFLSLAKDGVSIVKVANETSASGGEFSGSDTEIGTALIGPNIGTALFQRTFTGDPADGFGAGPDGDDGAPLDPDGAELSLADEQITETSRSFFDSQGNKFAQEDSASFAEGGKLAIKEELLPKLLSSDFKVEFEATDWDCSGTEDLETDMESAGFKACSTNFTSPFEDEECGGDGFEIGLEEKDIGEIAHLDPGAEGVFEGEPDDFFSEFGEDLGPEPGLEPEPEEE
jgi:hypothetical protein